MRDNYTAPVFVDLMEGHLATSPIAGSSVVICAEAWRDAPLGARQTRCEGCDALLGISQRHWQYRQDHPLSSAILCLLCSCAFRRMYRADMEQRAARIREHAPPRKGKVRRVQ